MLEQYKDKVQYDRWGGREFLPYLTLIFTDNFTLSFFFLIKRKLLPKLVYVCVFDDNILYISGFLNGTTQLL